MPAGGCCEHLGTGVRVGGSRFGPQVPAGAVYVGRESPYLKRSPYANPYSLKRCTLTESQALFRANVLPSIDLAPLRGLERRHARNRSSEGSAEPRTPN